VLLYTSKAELSEVKRGVRYKREQIGVAKTDVKEERKAYVNGEPWNAETDESTAEGDRVMVTEANGMTVKVRKQRGEV
jgi:membrane protein implicated in regulation of membrane protease activity